MFGIKHIVANHAGQHTCFSGTDDCVDRHEQENASDEGLPGRTGRGQER